MRALRIQVAILGVAGSLLWPAGPAAQASKAKPTSTDIPGTVAIGCFLGDGVCHDGNDPDFGAGNPLWNSSYGDDRLTGDTNGIVAALLAGSRQLRFQILNTVIPQRRAYVIAIPGVRIADNSLECGVGPDPCVLAPFVSDDANNAGSGLTLAARVGPDGNAGGLTNVQGPNGLLGMTRNQTVRTTFILGFQVGASDPAPAARWALHWNNAIYPGSGLVNVTRTGTCTWRVWSDGSSAELAGLLLYGYGTVGKGKIRDEGNYEGRFSMPFQIDFTADAAVMPGGCS